MDRVDRAMGQEPDHAQGVLLERRDEAGQARFTLAGCTSLTIAVCLGCGPDARSPSGEEAGEYARTLCAALTECGCVQRFSTEVECVDEMEARFDAALAAAPNIDLSCYERVVPAAAWKGCEVEMDPGFRCVLMRGTRGEGESCTEWRLTIPPFLVDECAEGLGCVRGACVMEGGATEPISVGQSCDPGDVTACEAGAYCGYDAQCHPQSGLGSPCDHPFACDGAIASASYCAGIGGSTQGTCVEVEQQGEACDPLDAFPCSASAWCDPSVSRCVESGAWVCTSMDHFLAWPER